MEPDVIRLYSSSPPPLDDGAEEDDDDFGDFGGFSGVPSSVSFTEFDTPSAFGQSQTATAADTSPPNHFDSSSSTGLTELSPGPLGRVSIEDVSPFPGPDSQGPEFDGSRDGCPPGKTVSAEELKKLVDQTRPAPYLNSSDPEAGSGRTEVEAYDCNGGFAVAGEVLTNGFAAFDTQDAPSCPETDHPKNKGTAAPTPDCSPEDEFDDFFAFSGTDAPRDDGQSAGVREHRDEGAWPAAGEGGSAGAGIEENGVRDSHSVGPDPHDYPAAESLANGHSDSLVDEDSEQRDVKPWGAHRESAAEGHAEGPAAQNGTEQAEEGVEQEEEEEEEEESGMSEGGASPSGPEDGGEGTEGGECVAPSGTGVSVSESFASFCQAVSPDGEEDFGDFSTSGFVPPVCPEEDLTEETEDFGDFGDASSSGGQGFADFERTELKRPSGSTDSAKESGDEVDEGDFGDFSAPQDGSEGKDSQGFADFPGSDSFADFSSAPAGGADVDAGAGWSAFGDQEQEQGGDDSWAAFGQEQSTTHSESEERPQDSAAAAAPPSGSPQTCRRDSLSAALASRLERLFRASFPEAPAPEAQEEVLSLKALLEPPESEEQREEAKEEQSVAPHGDLRAVWRQLQEIHDALGLRYQWGGSHSNKALLCSLGIDTRNILFTGQKKQPVIVPMYAASLGMLEPTKEPVKPISAAEKIASIAQAPPVSPEMSACSPDPSQEVLPPVQFDWSSSGLTNPLDGVDPELYELTTAKLDTSNTGSRIADAFARLMSTVEKTSTSTRKPKKEEHLSEEAAKVIAGLPDLSFMQAKVLMFPATLTPLGCSAPTPD
ncbi:aftiphilin a isoform X2 [Megalops cyprinoides]|uniref:aftiphilin a isoform X2 n=1 Tax=Megalops cyprinoides TaxID=118141 RepID=UPI001863B97A|nr:aftiphilin a isoform X2 [Megalops cyprinoides]